MRYDFTFNQLKRKFDYALSLSYMRMLVYLCLVFVGLLLLVMLMLWVVSLASERFNPGDVNIPGTAFMLLTDPGNISNVLPSNDSWLVGVFYAVTVTIGAVLFGGVLISLMSNSVQMRVDNFKNGIIHYRHKDHLVVIGYDPLVPALVRQLKDKYQDQDIIVFTKKSSAEVRESLATMVDVKDKKLILYSGRRDSENDLAHLHVEQAREVFIIGNRENDDHDALNFACLLKLVGLLRKAQSNYKPIINILLENQSTQTILQSTNLAEEWCKWARVIPFSFYENWARQVLSAEEVPVDSPDGKTEAKKSSYCYPQILVDKDSQEWVNIVIFGMSRLGLTVGIEAAHALHYPKQPNGKVRKTKITFISKSAYDEMLLFRARFRQIFEIQTSRYLDYIGSENDKSEDLPKETVYRPTYFTGKDADFLDIDFEFIRGDAFSEQIHQLLKERALDSTCKMNVFTCTGHDSTDMNIGLLLPDEVLQNANIFIRQHHTGQLMTKMHHISEKGKGKYAHVYPFGMTNSRFDLSHKSQEMGILINFFYNCSNKYKEIFQPGHLLTEDECRKGVEVWNNSSIADQWSSFYCCHSFAHKMAQWGIKSIDEDNIQKIENIIKKHIDTLAYIEHNRWNMEKLLMGFRKPRREESLEIEECRKAIADNTENTELKKECIFKFYKTERMVHDYIRSFDDLATITWKDFKPEDDVRKIDNNMLGQIPWIIKNRKQLQNNPIILMTNRDYTPNPVDTSDIQLPEELNPLLEAMAKNVHEIWAQERISQGWTYGEKRDDVQKHHPCLVAYEDLPEEEKVYDRNTSIETLKLIYKLGFKINTK